MQSTDWLHSADDLNSKYAQRVSAAELKELTTKSDLAGITRIAFHGIALIATGAWLWLSESVLMTVLATLVHGFVLAFLFCAQHETAHRTAFASKTLNDAVGHTVGFLLFLPHHAFRAFHWDHHRYAQDKERDPELANPLPRSHAGVLWMWLGGPNWLSRARGLGKHGLHGKVSEPWIPVKQHVLIIRESRIYLAGYALLLLISVLLQSTLLVWLWLVPVICGYWFLRPYLLSEHTGCPHDGDRVNRTRTTYTNALLRLFAWNMPFHTEHHAYPAVPFHALPKLHQRIKPQLVNTAPGYLVSWWRTIQFLIQSDKS